MVRHSGLVKMLAAAIVVSGLMAATAKAADPNGTWNWTFNRQGQDVELSVSLKADGDKLTGTFKGPIGDPVEIKDGVFKDDEVNFLVEFEFNGNVIKTKYKGKVEGDTIKGKTERERDGQVVMRDWEAKREKK